MASTVYMCVILACTMYTVDSVSNSRVTLVNNEYHDIVIAIEENVPEDLALLDKIQEVFTDASAFLCEITRYRAYFKNITILVPKFWSDNVQYEMPSFESYYTSDIRIDNSDYDGPYVWKSTPCGELGEYMHLTADYLTDSTIGDNYGDYDKVIVHEWGHLRYGVYDEYPGGNTGAPYFYANSNGDIEATRCSTAVTGDMVNLNTGQPCAFVNNYPEDDCYFYDDRNVATFTGSLMYRQYLPQKRRLRRGRTGQYQRKIKTLRIKYREVTEHNNRSGRDPKTMPFWDELHKILDGRPAFNPQTPVFLLSEKLIHFCDNDTFADTPGSIHNIESPSKHNILCDEKSVWEASLSFYKINSNFKNK
uniref:Calcium-activated chloride channel regulator 4-like n=1 Tax=Saccoglossus kowalevskii TaxID=10224 RepID=A0ABM0GXY4_SACKO|nr:PREDICTED: calcium-activated chloride channel regulator 4-like [Saccoglossus kowalevskii]